MKIEPSTIQAEDFDIILPIKLVNGNKGRTTHFGASAKRRKEYAKLLRSLGLVKEPPRYRQTVFIERLIGKGERSYDPDSLLRGNAKEILDSLVECGWFVDDSAQWLEWVNAGQKKDAANGSMIRVYVRNYEKS